MTLHTTLFFSIAALICGLICGIGIKVYKQRKEMDFAKVTAIVVISTLLLGFTVYLVKGA